MENSQQEGHGHIVVPFLEFSDEFPTGRVLEDNCGRFQVLSDVFELKMDVVRPRTEKPLGAGHRAEQELVPDAWAISVALPQRATNAGQQNLSHENILSSVCFIH